MRRKKESRSENARDKARLHRSGAAESGYGTPSFQDVNDIAKSHLTRTQKGAINADEAVRREENWPGPIDSLSGEVSSKDEKERAG
jgi:hypothetical protein